MVLVSIDCLNSRQLDEALAERTAPHLLDLAGDSLVFSRGYAHSPWTTPSHTSMLSGLYPSQHGRDLPYGPLIRFTRGVDRVPLYRTLPERLAASGYETLGFVGRGMMSARFGLSQGFARYEDAGRDNDDQSDLPSNLSGIREWVGRRSGKPFFLLLHTYELHYPRARDRRSLPRALAYVDRHLGMLIRLLHTRGLYDSTLIILTGDHGSEMIHAEQKCSVHGAGHYEENLRVPFLVKLPAGGPRGPRDTIVRHVDIVPTVLDVLELRGEAYDGPGSSIVARLAKGGGDPEPFSYSEADGRCWLRRAIVERRYKYIYTPPDPLSRVLHRSPLFFDDVCERHPPCRRVPREELYDLQEDPFEEGNLLRSTLDEGAAAALERLRERLAAHMDLRPRYRHRVLGSRSRHPPDDVTTDALRALGYVQ